MTINPPFISPIAWPDAAQQPAFWAELCQTLLPPYINTCRWFAGKARQQTGLHVRTVMPLSIDAGSGKIAYLTILSVSYAEGTPESYLLPLSFVSDRATQGRQFGVADVPDKGRIGEVQLAGQAGLLIDAIYDERFRSALFDAIYTSQVITMPEGQIRFQRGRGLEDGDANLPSRVLPVDSSNSAMTFGDKYFVKLYRKLFAKPTPKSIW